MLLLLSPELCFVMIVVVFNDIDPAAKLKMLTCNIS